MEPVSPDPRTSSIPLQSSWIDTLIPLDRLGEWFKRLDHLQKKKKKTTPWEVLLISSLISTLSSCLSRAGQVLAGVGASGVLHHLAELICDKDDRLMIAEVSVKEQAFIHLSQSLNLPFLFLLLKHTSVSPISHIVSSLDLFFFLLSWKMFLNEFQY